MSQDKYEKIDEKISAQTQSEQPGIEAQMSPKPIYDDVNYIGAEKLKGKNALITGGDSGIGRAIAIAFAKEGANIVLNYRSTSPENVAKEIEALGVKCLTVKADIGDFEQAKDLVSKAI